MKVNFIWDRDKYYFRDFLNRELERMRSYTIIDIKFAANNDGYYALIIYKE